MSMICPKCNVKLALPEGLDSATSIQCPKCDAVFRPADCAEPAVAVQPEPTKSRYSRPSEKRSTEKPRYSRPGEKPQEKRKFPMVWVVSGAVSVVVIIGVILAITLGGKSKQTASNSNQETDQKQTSTNSAEKARNGQDHAEQDQSRSTFARVDCVSSGKGFRYVRDFFGADVGAYRDSHSLLPDSLTSEERPRRGSGSRQNDD